MASITITAVNPANLNPTSLFVPVRIGSQFEDSLIQTNDQQDQIFSSQNGWKVVPGSHISYVGDYDGTNNGTLLTVDDAGTLITFTSADASFELSGNLIVSVASGAVELSGTNLLPISAGAASGKYLLLTINGAQYKINLLNP